MSTWTNLFLLAKSKYDKCEVINQHQILNKNFVIFFLFFHFSKYILVLGLTNETIDKWFAFRLIHLFCRRMNSIKMIKTWSNDT